VLILSRIAYRRSWPYAVAILLVVCAVGWVSPTGFLRNRDAHFEWTSSEGFTALHLQDWHETGGAWHSGGRRVWRSIVEAQIQPLLRSYFNFNDWQKMNGNISLRMVRIIPIAWPVAIGSCEDTFEDPDQTALMRAAAREDLTAVKQILSSATDANVNALDQAGQTALILACQNPSANPRVVEALLAAGADVKLRGRDNYAALTWALLRNNSEVIRLLRRANGRP
jgi:Ankyrin repeats (3 copies)